MARAAVYTRISEDPKSRGGRGANVATQEEDCRELAAHRGYEVVGVYCDNDLTAADPKVTRPAFESLLEAVLAGDVDVVLAYQQDRFVRRTDELERVLATFTVTGARLELVVGASDFESDEGQLYARFNTMLGTYEVAKTRRRVLRKMRAIAEEGGPLSGKLGYGFADKLTVNDEHAEVIREGARRVLDGEPLAVIARDWNARGLPAPNERWTPSALRRVLLAPRTAGLRVHQGEVIGKAQWPPILDEPTWRRVGRVLTNPRRNMGGDRGAKLLTGIATCGKCGGGLNSKHSHGARRYHCRHCWGVLVYADRLEQHVVGAVCDAYDSAPLARALDDRAEVDVDDLARRLLDAEREGEELAEAVGSGLMAVGEWKIARKLLAERTDRLREELAAATTGRPEWLGRGTELAAKWETMPSAEQRRVLLAVLVDVQVAPAVRGVNRYDPRRVSITWRY